MSMLILFTASVLFVLANSPGQQTEHADQEKQNKPDKPAEQEKRAEQVRRLVAQLDGDERAQRVAAEKALLEMGPKVLDLLPQVTNRTAAEVKERLERIRKTLETAAVEAATRASLVTLQGEMTLHEALTAMEKQTGNKVMGYQNRDAKITVEFDKTPYWEAIDKVFDQGELNVNKFGGQSNALVVTARPDSMASRYGGAAYNGVFRMEAIRVVASRDLRTPEVEGLRVTVEVSWEPRTSPITIVQPVDQLKATAENGDSVDAGSTGMTGGAGMIGAPVQSGMSAIDLEIPFSLPSRDVKEIASLKGNLTVTAPGRVETFQFDELVGARDIEQKKAGVTLLLERVRKNSQLYEVRIRVRFDNAANALESHRGWIFNNEAYLLSDTGNRIDYATLETTRQDRNEVGLAYLFDLEKPPHGFKFVYKTPAGIVRKSIPFELKDIKLP